MSKIRAFIWDHRYGFIILAIIALALEPILSSPFLSDDGIYYFLHGERFLDGYGIKELIINGIKSWLARGRFFPFSIYALILLYYVRSAYIYKFLIIVSTCIDVILFGQVVERLIKSKDIKYLAMLASVLFFQVYVTYHNALTGFQLLMQVIFAMLMITILCIQTYYKNGKMRYLVIGTVVYLISLLTYELSFAFFPIIISLIWFYRQRAMRIRKEIALFLLPVLIVGGINVVLKMNVSIAYEGISASFDTQKIFVTFLKQCVAAIPLSNYIFQRNNGIFPHGLKAIIRSITLSDICITTAFCVLMYVIIKKACESRIDIKLTRLLVFATMMFTMPAALISLSDKYQKELSFGIGYLPVFLEYFGLILIFITVFIAIVQKCRQREHTCYLRRTALIIGIGICAFVLLMNMQNERYSINSTQNMWYYNKLAAQDSISLGILNGIDSKETVTIESPMPWDSSSFLSEYANRRIDYKAFSDKNEQNNDVLIFRYSGSSSGCTAFSGKMIDAKQSGTVQLVQSARVYTNDLENSYVVYSTINKEDTIENHIVSLSDLELLGAYGTGRLYQLDEEFPVMFKTITFIKNYSPANMGVDVNFGEGVYSLESANGQSWRWCEPSAQINLVNYQSVEIPVYLHFSVTSLSDSDCQLTVISNDRSMSYSYKGPKTEMVIQIIAYPGDNDVELVSDSPLIQSTTDNRIMSFQISDIFISSTS